MQLGDTIKLYVSRKSAFNDEPDITDGEFIIIGLSKQLSRCFGDSMYSNGFSSFEYGKVQDDRPDVVRMGAIYTATPEILDNPFMKDMHYDNKIVSWEVMPKESSESEQ